MKKLVRAFSDRIRGELAAWGLTLPRARAFGGLRVRVDLATPTGGHVHVGDLTQEAGEFVFRYAKSFAASDSLRPIPAFPDLDREYRDRQLFPFFAVRLPPLSREDVRDALHRLKISGDDPLRVLGSLAKKTISSPYEFALAGSNA